MIKPKSICPSCSKIKGVSCVCPEPATFQGFDRTNQSFYSSTKWRKYSHSLRREFPLCQLCKENGKVVLSEMVDHVQSINSGGDKWNRKNLMCLCHSCHNKKSGRTKKNQK